MNHFLHLLILLPALFNTIIALPAPVFDTSDSWADFPLENGDALLAATFGGVTDNPLTSPASIYNSPTQPDALPATPATPPIVQPLPIVKDQDWAKPMFLCCKSTSWLNDDEVKCTITRRFWNDENCKASQGTAKYCPNGIHSDVKLDCYRYRAGPELPR